ncbi:anti-FecI sigma factor, FecR [Allomuricauda ruestringensis DSM 13258]|uniref:Anti-FecI sigma factor, FecR n=2 Tax=Flagellimonas TaxID=444459 RepID=G2PQS5_ALLRU|nr:anti-FecI sigma factor, FecR [Allomuricauda ruestringensis DSM 13258]
MKESSSSIMKKNITKLLLGTISEKEIMELQDWLENPNNQKILEAYVRDYHDLNLATLKNDLDEAYSKVNNRIGDETKPIKRLFPDWMKYAAAVIVLMALGLIYQKGFFSTEDQYVLVPKEDTITLELNNGIVQSIDASGNKEYRDREGNVVYVQKQGLIQYSKVTENEVLLYNTLLVPNGKTFQIELSDGTRVQLNAGSSLKYPVNFLEEGLRKVFLTGNAYFDVAKNTANPFVVSVDELDVKVLGTEFNISAYEEDENIDVVLVEGAVNMAGKNQSQALVELVPGQKGSFDPNSKDVLVEEVDTSLYTSWRQGSLVYRELAFNKILKKLERHYNIEIVNNNVELGEEVFNARFDRMEIEEVLGYFKDIHDIDFAVENNKVTIN